MLALTIGALFPALTVTAEAAELPEITRAQGAYLYNFENDFVLFEDGMDARIYPGSTVKLMTGLLSMEALGSRLDDKITVTKEMLNGVYGNNIGLQAGEIVKVRDMIAALLIGGANDAAQVLAVTIGGTLNDFITMMNRKAQEIGMYSTYYTNVTGMHSDAMITTVGDVAIIAKYVYAIPGYTDFTSMEKYVMDETNKKGYRNIFNRNAQVSKYYEIRYWYPDAIGLNAGYTNQNGYCLVSVARRAGLTYLCIVMNAEDDKNAVYSYYYANNMLEFAFASYSYTEVLSKGQRLAEVPVELSSVVDYVTLVSSDSIVRFLPTSTDLSQLRISCVPTSETLTAPVKQGQICGTATVSLGDTLLGTTTLVATMDIERSEFLYTLSQIRDFTSGTFFRATVISFVLFGAAYVAWEAYSRRPKRGRW